MKKLFLVIGLDLHTRYLLLCAAERGGPARKSKNAPDGALPSGAIKTDRVTTRLRGTSPRTLPEKKRFRFPITAGCRRPLLAALPVPCPALGPLWRATLRDDLPLPCRTRTCTDRPLSACGAGRTLPVTAFCLS